MSETQEVKKFQWVKGDKIGKVETVKNEDREWITFNGGGRIAQSLLQEFMMPVNGDDVVIDDIANEVSAPPKPQQEPKKPISVDTTGPERKLTPIMSLFTQMENTEKHTLKIQVDVNIPDREVYGILAKSFGSESVRNTVKDYIVDQLTPDKIQDAIDSSIVKIIETFNQPK